MHVNCCSGQDSARSARGDGVLHRRCRRAFDVGAGIRCASRSGRLAQLVRASPLQGEGRGFESLSAHRVSLVAGRLGHAIGGRMTLEVYTYHIEPADRRAAEVHVCSEYARFFLGLKGF
jgi:hypothetical protein